MAFSSRKMLILSVFLCQVVFSFGVEVSTPKGKIVGSENRKSRDGRVIYSFTGIPYAKPPVGELRYKVSKEL